MQMSQQLKILMLIFISILAAVAAHFVAVPLILLPADFEYSADVVSLDNFYEENLQRFIGEQRSVTTFSYRTEESKGGVLLIDNIFDVRTVAGDKIIRVNRQYGIDRLTGQHVEGEGNKNREGYLFAPRWLSKNRSFIYWHVSYDMPVSMLFAGEDIIEGVKVYRFTSNFGIDQTEDLSHLPGVPEERGVNLDVALSLWIEPVSGWLVKYEDQAIAYYYNKDGKRLNPWNSFSNRYSKSSISEQVNHAKVLRSEIILLELLIPFLIFVLGLVVIFYRRLKQNYAIGGAAVIVICMIAGSAYAWFTKDLPVEPVKIGIVQWINAEEFDQHIQGFKDSLAYNGYIEDESVIYHDTLIGADKDFLARTVRAYENDGVDLYYSLTTFGTLALKELVGIKPIVFSSVLYPKETGINESVNLTTTNTVGSRSWVNPETQMATLTEILPSTNSVLFVRREGEPNSTQQFIEFEQAGKDRGIEVTSLAVLDEGVLKERLVQLDSLPDVIYLACDTLILGGKGKDVVLDFAINANIPVMSCNRDGVVSGALFGLIADPYEQGRIAGEKAALILDGATPASLETSPVPRPLLYINVKVAEQLGLSVPQTVLSSAKEIIN